MTNREKALLHIYADASGIARATYVNILREHAGVSSSADPDMSQGGYRRAMAALERCLWAAVDAGRVDPASLPAWISRRGYWASRCPQRRELVGPSKVHLIHALQDELGMVLDGTALERDQYIQASMERAIKTRVAQVSDLTDRQADVVINLLRILVDRHSLVTP